MSSLSSPAEKKTSQPRQRAGAACEECRRRKLRCDGKQPQCEPCFEAGVLCVTPTNHPQRGPKRGHLKALQTRMGIAPSHGIKSLNHGANEITLQLCLSNVFWSSSKMASLPLFPASISWKGLPLMLFWIWTTQLCYLQHQ